MVCHQDYENTDARAVYADGTDRMGQHDGQTPPPAEEGELPIPTNTFGPSPAVRLQIPLKLYGREQETDTILSSFERVSRGSREMLLVAGYTGIGKSSLVREVHKPLVERKAHFVSMRFDQHDRQDIPHFILAQALRKVFWQMTAEREEELVTWKERLSEGLGSNGKVIAEVIPELELIVGVQPAVQDLPKEEAHARFNAVLRRLLSCLATREHPLVIFMDNLQWADGPSLDLVQWILTEPGAGHLLVIGAYRDNEVYTNHALMKKLREIQEMSVATTVITLGPMGLVHVDALISETLGMEPHECRELGAMCFQKTNGNPFFLQQFLHTLHDRGLLRFDPGPSRWVWDIESIKPMQAAYNVIELLITKIGSLSPESQNIIGIAACLGDRFDVKTLSMACDMTFQDTVRDLRDVIRMGLIIPLNESSGHKQANSRELMPWTALGFIHERVMQAAYSLVPAGQRVEMHLRIGRRLLDASRRDNERTWDFEIVGQLNKGRTLMTSRSEKVMAAEMNLEAGRRVKAAMDYLSALDYIRAGMWFLDEDSWKHEYDLACALYAERAECEYLNMGFEEAARFLDELLKNARTNADKARALFRKTTLYASMGKHMSAVMEGLKGLRLVGVRMGYRPGRAVLCLEMGRMRHMLRKKQVSTLCDLPEMKDTTQLMIMDFMLKLSDSAFFTSQRLWMMIIMRMVRISSCHGNCSASAFAYNSLGLILASVKGDYETGQELGKVALSLCGRYRNPLVSGKVMGIFGGMINPGREPLDTGIECIRQGMEQSMQAGDFAYAGYNAVDLLCCLFVRGTSLPRIQETCRELMDFLARIKSGTVLYVHITLGLINNLQGNAKLPFNFGSRSFNEAHMGKVKNKQILFWYYLQKCHLYLLTGKYMEARDMIGRAGEQRAGALGQVHLPDYYLLLALILAHDFPSASFMGKRSRLRIIRKSQRRLKAWAANCPGNWMQKYLLVCAELERVMRSDRKAMDLYDKAIEHARRNGFVQDEALASELASRFHKAMGRDEIAQSHLRDARNAYARWGATRKAWDIGIMNPGLDDGQDVDAHPDEALRAGQAVRGNASPHPFDMAPVLKSCQAISGEAELNRLLERVLLVTMEHTGARKGFLIVKNGNSHVVEARIAADDGPGVTFPSEGLEKSRDLPLGIVRHVEHTHEILALEDAAGGGSFATDQYVMERKPRSILCVPFMRSGSLLGLLYLEHGEIAGAFTSDMVEALGMLSPWIAVSLDNARLNSRSGTSRRVEGPDPPDSLPGAAGAAGAGQRP